MLQLLIVGKIYGERLQELNHALDARGIELGYLILDRDLGSRVFETLLDRLFCFCLI